MAIVRMTAKDLKNRTGDAFRAVQRGDDVFLTRRGKPIAILRPVPADERPRALPPFAEAWGEIESALAASSPEFPTWREAMRRTRRRP